MPLSVKGLRVATTEGRHFIMVPARSAGALRTYLQTQGITCSHPEHVTGETCSVEVRVRDNLDRVQEMLNLWGRAKA